MLGAVMPLTAQKQGLPRLFTAKSKAAGQGRTMKGCTSPRVPVHMSTRVSGGTSGREDRGCTMRLPVLPCWARSCSCLAALRSLRPCLRLSEMRSLRSEAGSGLEADVFLPSCWKLRNRPPSAVTPCRRSLR